MLDDEFFDGDSCVRIKNSLPARRRPRRSRGCFVRRRKRPVPAKPGRLGTGMCGGVHHGGPAEEGLVLEPFRSCVPSVNRAATYVAE